MKLPHIHDITGLIKRRLLQYPAGVRLLVYWQIAYPLLRRATHVAIVLVVLRMVPVTYTVVRFYFYMADYASSGATFKTEPGLLQERLYQRAKRMGMELDPSDVKIEYVRDGVAMRAEVHYVLPIDLWVTTLTLELQPAVTRYSMVIPVDVPVD